jgi:hypothetical protein
MQRATLEVILKAVFGVSDAERLVRLRRLMPQLLDASSMSMQVRMLARRIRDAGPVPALRALTDESCFWRGAGPRPGSVKHLFSWASATCTAWRSSSCHGHPARGGKHR